MLCNLPIPHLHPTTFLISGPSVDLRNLGGKNMLYHTNSTEGYVTVRHAHSDLYYYMTSVLIRRSSKVVREVHSKGIVRIRADKIQISESDETSTLR